MLSFYLLLPLPRGSGFFHLLSPLFGFWLVVFPRYFYIYINFTYFFPYFDLTGWRCEFRAWDTAYYMYVVI